MICAPSAICIQRLDHGPQVPPPATTSAYSGSRRPLAIRPWLLYQSRTLAPSLALDGPDLIAVLG